MKVNVNVNTKKYPTFKSIPVSDLFVWDGNVHMKTSSDSALKLGGGNDSFVRIEAGEQVNEVTEVTVEIKR